MAIENNWAPPTIGDIRLPDRDLGRRLSRQPSVEMRAKMLGLDWTTLCAARVRLLIGAWMITAAVALLAVALGTQQDPRVMLAFVAAPALAALFGLRSISRFPVQIARNDRSTANSYAMLARLAPSRSLLGYRVRWILLRHAVSSVAAVAAIVLLAWAF